MIDLPLLSYLRKKNCNRENLGVGPKSRDLSLWMKKPKWVLQSLVTDGFQARWRWRKEKEDKEVIETKMLRGKGDGKRSHYIDVVIDPGKIFLIAAVLKITGLSLEEEEQLKQWSIALRKDEYLRRKVQLWKREKVQKRNITQEEVDKYGFGLKRDMAEWKVEKLEMEETNLLKEEEEILKEFKTKNGRKKWRRKMKKRHALLCDPNFSSYFLSGKEWRFWLNPTEKPKTNREKRKKKREEREKKERKKEEKKQFREENRRLIEEREKETEEEKEPASRGKRPHPALRLKRFRNHQKAVSRVANALIQKAKELYHGCFPEKKKETLPPIRLLWGDGSFPHTGNHHPPCPNKGLRNSLAPFFSKVGMVSEKYSTKASPCCDEDSFVKEGPRIGVKIIDVC